jgi:predicted kinase
VEAIIFIGIQATGKSTFYRDRFGDTHLRINLDMVKTRHRERQIFETCLAIGQPLVIDNTNPTIADRQRYLVPAIAAKFKVIGYYFESKIDDAIARNNQRDRQVPERGIRGTHAKLELPDRAEGFDELYYVKILPTLLFEISPWQI